MEENEKKKIIVKAKTNTTISEIAKKQIEESKYPVVGAIFNNEYKNLEFDVTVVADSIQSSNEAFQDWAPANLQEIYGILGKDAVAATKPSN